MLSLYRIGVVIIMLLSPTLAHAAAAPLSASFSLVPRASDPLARSTLTMDPNDLVMSIDRTLLEKPLLFLPTVVTNSTTDKLPSSLGTKRVFFKLIGNQLYLLENTAGETVLGPFQPEKIIAEFPIVEVGADHIRFDFKKGFEPLIIESAAYEDRHDSAVPVTASYLRDPVSRGDTFGFWHVVQTGGRSPVTVTFSYAFVPEQPAPFEPLPPPDDPSRLGFFLTPAIFARGTETTHQFISRWGLKQPIVFSISSNTPPEFRQAIHDGIEAWNDAFGRKVVIAQDAPAGVMIGDPRYNVFQWIELDDIGYARADWHINPLTGEILHANVLFLSGWAVRTREVAARILKQLDSAEAEQIAAAQFGLRGFTPVALCDARPFGEGYRHFLEEVASGTIPAEKLLPLVQRIVKTVAMHEVGHDLGLRHNFVGNLASQIVSVHDDEDLAALLLNGTRPADAPLPSSSIMDYLSYEDDMRMERPGEYDRAAIRWAYAASAAERASLWLPPFCTDEDTARDADCQRHDAWPDPLEWRIAADAPKNVTAFNKLLLQALTGEITKKDKAWIRRYLYLLSWDFDGMFNYISGDMQVRSLGGRSVPAREQRAGEGLLPYLFSGSADTAPAGAIVIPETLEKRDELQEIIQQIHVAIVEMFLGRIGMPKSDTHSLSIAEPAQGPITDGLVHVAGNAGIGVWFADADEDRSQATTMIAGLEPLVQERLRAKLKANIAALEQARAATTDVNERTRIQARIDFEQQLLVLLSVSPPTSPLPRELPPSAG